MDSSVVNATGEIIRYRALRRLRSSGCCKSPDHDAPALSSTARSLLPPPHISVPTCIFEVLTLQVIEVVMSLYRLRLLYVVKYKMRHFLCEGLDWNTVTKMMVVPLDVRPIPTLTRPCLPPVCTDKYCSLRRTILSSTRTSASPTNSSSKRTKGFGR